MSTYTRSTGEQIDTAEMATTYIERALLKAQSEGNQENIDALEEELGNRDQ